MSSTTLPYENSTAGDSAIGELQRILQKFGCSAFGVMTDADKGTTTVQFRHRGRMIALEASWRGYARAYLRAHPYNRRMRRTEKAHEQKAIEQGQIAVSSILRDWVKAQITAVECEIMTFDAAFMPHMMLADGRRLIDVVDEKKLLPAPQEAA